MNWELLAPLLITTVVAIVGWFSGHFLSVSRDRANKHRDIRLEYLIEAYRCLENAGGRDLPSSPEQSRDLESAIADIQLFGNLAQIAKLNECLDKYAKEGDAYLDGMINDLRGELREELGLPTITGNVRWLRINQRKKRANH